MILFVVLAAGCSQTPEAASPSTTAAPESEESAPTPTTTVDEDLVEPLGESTTTAPQAESPDRQPAPDAAVLAELGGQLLYRTTDGVIAVSSPNGDNVVTLSNTTPLTRSQPTWSNDGSQVAWSSFGAAGPMVTLAAADGSDRTDLNAPTNAFFLSWSLDDSLLAGLGPSAQGVELFVAETSTNDILRVGTGEPFFIDWVDDSSLVGAINATSLVDLAVGANTSTERELPGSLGTFQAPASLDAGRSIIALDNGLGGNNVVIVSDEGIEVVATAPGSTTFSPNPTGDSVAILVTDDDPNAQPIFFQTNDVPTLPPNRVSIVDLVTGEVDSLDIDDALATMWSPDGSTLAVLFAQPAGLEWRFIRDGETLPGDPFIPSQAFFNSYVPFADQYERSSTWWSPDSRAVVFSGSIDGDDGIWVDLVDDGRGAQLVADGDIAFWSPAQ